MDYPIILMVKKKINNKPRVKKITPQDKKMFKHGFKPATRIRNNKALSQKYPGLTNKNLRYDVFDHNESFYYF
jgi:hypothetical protein